MQNTRRSQIAHAFAEQERDERGLQTEVELISGGTNPSNQPHSEVIEVMQAIGIGLSGRTPREVTAEERQDSDYVITMGCSADDVCPAGWGGENRDWGLPDPHGTMTDEVTDIRDKIQSRVRNLFDEISNE